MPISLAGQVIDSLASFWVKKEGGYQMI